MTSSVTPAEPTPTDAPLRLRQLEARVQVLEQAVRELAAALDRLELSDAAIVIRRTFDQLPP